MEKHIVFYRRDRLYEFKDHLASKASVTWQYFELSEQSEVKYRYSRRQLGKNSIPWRPNFEEIFGEHESKKKSTRIRT